ELSFTYRKNGPLRRFFREFRDWLAGDCNRPGCDWLPKSLACDREAPGGASGPVGALAVTGQRRGPAGPAEGGDGDHAEEARPATQGQRGRGVRGRGRAVGWARSGIRAWASAG